MVIAVNMNIKKPPRVSDIEPTPAEIRVGYQLGDGYSVADGLQKDRRVENSHGINNTFWYLEFRFPNSAELDFNVFIVRVLPTRMI